MVTRKSVILIGRDEHVSVTGQFQLEVIREYLKVVLLYAFIEKLKI